MQNYIATISCNDDFWILLRTESATKILEFFYSDEDEARKIAETVKSAVEAATGTTFDHKEIEADFIEIPEGYLFIDPTTNSKYTGDSEGGCLETAVLANPSLFDTQGIKLVYEDALS